MSDKFYAIERFVVPHDGVILKITPLEKPAQICPALVAWWV
ncbi:hypothetical protein [Mastigocoleus testarum]|nr:hypothetical protein [Mastigocoleus testarum]